MSFRKRNIGISSSSSSTGSPSTSTSADPPNPTTVPGSTALGSHTPPSTLTPGTRPSPLDGRPTTSTGTSSLDSLLAGHAGLPLGYSLLIEESGTTDYAGPLLRHYAAEGVVQGHVVHVVGVGEAWMRELPGVVEESKGRVDAPGAKEERERMKIAWRYERLGAAAAGEGRRAAVDRAPQQATTTQPPSTPTTFCHTFDLAKRLPIPSAATILHYPITTAATTSPFLATLHSLTTSLRATPPQTIHRLVIPSLLSPALYPPHASTPAHILQFLHALRALLRLYPAQLTFMASLPLTLYPRASALIRTAEHLFDGVLELTPFPHTLDDALSAPSLASSGAATASEEKPQGMLTVHKLPVLHERGGGGGGPREWADDLAFTVSRRRFVIRPLSLPPAEGDTEAQKSGAESGLTKETIDF